MPFCFLWNKLRYLIQCNAFYGSVAFALCERIRYNKEKYAKGEIIMDYSKEVKEKWGNTEAYAEYAAKSYSKDKQSELAKGMEIIFCEFSACMQGGETPDSDKVNKLQSYISENFYNCTEEIFLGLGEMYTADERFKKNIDKYAAGTAEYVSKAIICHLK